MSPMMARVRARANIELYQSTLPIHGLRRDFTYCICRPVIHVDFINVQLDTRISMRLFEVVFDRRRADWLYYISCESQA